MWSDEKYEMRQNIKQSFIWAVWYVLAWAALMLPVVKAML